MTNPNIANYGHDTRFKPGHQGPGRGANWIKSSDIKDITGKMFKMNRAELLASLQRPESTMLELIIGQILIMAAKKGDPMRLEYILNRVVGRCNVEQTIDKNGEPIKRVYLPDGTVIEHDLREPIPTPDPTEIDP